MPMEPPDAATIADFIAASTAFIESMGNWAIGTPTGGDGDGYYPILNLSGSSVLAPSPAKVASLVPTGQPTGFILGCLADNTIIPVRGAIAWTRMLGAFSCSGVRAWVAAGDQSMVGTHGIEIDVRLDGTSIFQPMNRLIVPPQQTTSKAAGNPQPVLLTSLFADDALLSVDVLTAGVNARGLRVAFEGIPAIVASRGSGAANLLSADPKEVWADSAVGSAATIDIDLGGVHPLNSVFLGYIHGADPAASWTITGGVAAYAEMVLKAAGPLRVPDVAGELLAISHGLWFGADASVRYLRLSITQPEGSPALMAGVLLVGHAFQPDFNREWGSGRRPIDTGTATPLPGGGFGIAEGARKLGFTWTFGDLGEADVLALEDIALACGETRPLLVVEDPAPSAGLRRRIHYGLFEKFKAFERRNRVQTRWELGIEQWV
jgi:hypothetical protein